MRSSTSALSKGANGKVGSAMPSKAVLCVIGLVTCMQISFHFLMSSKVQQEDDTECSGSTSTPYCAEAAIFKQWQVRAANSSDEKFSALAEPEDSEILDLPAMTTGTPIDVLEALRAVSEVSLDALSRTTAAPATSVTESHANASAAGDTPSVELNSRNAMEESSTKNDIWKSYEDPSSWDNMTDWARDLIAVQGRFEERMNDLPSFKRRKATESTTVPLTENEAEAGAVHLTDWAKNLVALQSKLQTEHDAIAAKHAARREESARRVHENARVSTTKASLRDEIWSYGRELCQDPRRRDYPSCAQFRKGSEHAADRFQAKDDPSTDRLQWFVVTAWQSAGSSALRGAQQPDFLQVAKSKLSHAKWDGKIPKVACVAVIPYGQDIKHQINYFVDGFKHQDYEGAMQLLLVHHHEDDVTRQLLKQYKDDPDIKLVASMGHRELTTTAFRFGAYMADADVIARYDFGAWHHPSRLSMQVRALAFAKRPVSHLQAWTARNYAEGGYAKAPTQAELQTLGEASLVGEKEWIAKNWYPLMGKETEGLAKQAAELDMPELLAYSSES